MTTHPCTHFPVPPSFAWRPAPQALASYLLPSPSHLETRPPLSVPGTPQSQCHLFGPRHSPCVLCLLFPLTMIAETYLESLRTSPVSRSGRMPHALPKLRGVHFHQIWFTSLWGHRAIYRPQTWYYQYTLLVPLWNLTASLRVTGGCQTLSANPPIHVCNVQEYFIPNPLHCRTENGALYPKVSSMNAFRRPSQLLGK